MSRYTKDHLPGPVTHLHCTDCEKIWPIVGHVVRRTKYAGGCPNCNSILIEAVSEATAKRLKEPERVVEVWTPPKEST